MEDRLDNEEMSLLEKIECVGEERTFRVEEESERRRNVLEEGSSLILEQFS